MDRGDLSFRFIFILFFGEGEEEETEEIEKEGRRESGVEFGKERKETELRKKSLFSFLPFYFS